MTWDLHRGMLNLAVKKGLLQLETLLEKGILDANTVERLMDEVISEDRQEPFASSDIAPAPSNGKVYGRYQELQFVASGAMADVYRAVDPLLNRPVALKLFRADARLRSQDVTAEARAQANIDHPNVCKVYEAGEQDGKPYIAMRYVNGTSLKDAAAELNLQKLAMLFVSIAEAVHAAHQIGMIHRDLKPGNILVEQTKDGEWIPYVMDFGFAREIAAPGISKTGDVVGTPWYMSPEQALGQVKTLDRRSDIFSLGSTFYEVLTGVVPFQGENTFEVLLGILEKDPVSIRVKNPFIPDDLQTIVMKCLEKEPARRYDSARALAEDLKRFLQGEPILARQRSWNYTIAKKIRKHPLISGLLAAALLLILVTGIFGLRSWINSQVRERLLNAFSSDLSRETETALRYTYGLPLHNAEPEKDLIRRAVKQYEPKLQNLGALALGPMHYVFGRDYMTVHDWETARKFLERAWFDYKYQEPQTAYALIVVDAQLYHHNRKAHFSDPTALEAVRRLYLSRTSPFRKVIEESTLEEADYARAWISFFENQYSVALKQAAKAFQRNPQFYEAKSLEAEIYMFMGEDRLRNEDAETALDFYRNAEKAYDTASAIAPSDSDVYQANCFLQLRMMMLQSQTPSAMHAYQKGLKACDHALIANPENRTAMQWRTALITSSANPQQ